MRNYFLDAFCNKVVLPMSMLNYDYEHGLGLCEGFLYEANKIAGYLNERILGRYANNEERAFIAGINRFILSGGDHLQDEPLCSKIDGNTNTRFDNAAHPTDILEWAGAFFCAKNIINHMGTDKEIWSREEETQQKILDAVTSGLRAYNNELWFNGYEG